MIASFRSAFHQGQLTVSRLALRSCLGVMPKIMMRFSGNRIMILSLCLSMIFSENRFPLFRIML